MIMDLITRFFKPKQQSQTTATPDLMVDGHGDVYQIPPKPKKTAVAKPRAQRSARKKS